MYGLHYKAINRTNPHTGARQSSFAAVAYRAGITIMDDKGKEHDYSHRDGVVYSEIVGWKGTREELWGAAEASGKRRNSVVAREVMIALPADATDEERIKLAMTYAERFSVFYNVAEDVAVHRPSKEGNERNHHAHILFTPRSIDLETGKFDKHASITWRREGIKHFLNECREMWATVYNTYYAIPNKQPKVDHRSYKARGIDKVPTRHRGKARTASLRKGRADPEPKLRFGQPTKEHLDKELGLRSDRLRELDEEIESLSEPEQSQVTEPNEAEPDATELHADASSVEPGNDNDESGWKNRHVAEIKDLLSGINLVKDDNGVQDQTIGESEEATAASPDPEITVDAPESNSGNDLSTGHLEGSEHIHPYMHASPCLGCDFNDDWEKSFIDAMREQLPDADFWETDKGSQDQAIGEGEETVDDLDASLEPEMPHDSSEDNPSPDLPADTDFDMDI